MNKFTSSIAALAIIGSACMSSAATAQDGVYTGTADVFKGIPLNCVVTANFDSTPGRVDLSIESPEANCAALGIISNPHTFSVSGGVLTIDNVNVNTITNGGCLDDLVATYDAVADTISINDTLDARDAGADCTIESNGPLTN